MIFHSQLRWEIFSEFAKSLDDVIWEKVNMTVIRYSIVMHRPYTLETPYILLHSKNKYIKHDILYLNNEYLKKNESASYTHSELYYEKRFIHIFTRFLIVLVPIHTNSSCKELLNYTHEQRSHNHRYITRHCR